MPTTEWRPRVRAGRWHEEGFSIMPLLQVLGILIVVGIVLWMVNNFIPMAGSIKSILNVVVVLCVLFWLANAFGVIHSLSKIRIGH